MRFKATTLCFNFILGLSLVLLETPSFAFIQHLPEYPTASFRQESAGFIQLEELQFLGPADEISQIQNIVKPAEPSLFSVQSRKTDFTPVVSVETKTTSKVITVKLVANNIIWSTFDEQVRQLQDWFSQNSQGQLTLEIEVIKTNFTNIPFVLYNNPANPELEGIEESWFDKNITPLGADSEIVLFVVDRQDWTKTPVRGWTFEQNQGAIRIQVGVGEAEVSYNPQDPFSPVSALLDYGRHELVHALFQLTGSEDLTHEYWFEGKFNQVFEALDYSKLAPDS